MRRFLLCWVVCLIHAAICFGQLTTATINGRVTDSTGGAVAGVQLTITNQETQLKRTTTSDSLGAYSVPLLPPGTYSVAAEKEGFRRTVLSGITLQVAQVARLDVSIALGELMQTVEASAQALLLQTENIEVGQVIERHLVESLPLNGRQFLQLAQLTPGVVQNAGGTPAQNIAGTQGPQLAINGNRQDANNYTIDGGTALDFLYNTLSVSPSIDAIQEFKVQSSLSSIQWGGQGGGYLNIVTRSGTSRFHGSAWEFLRNDKLNAHNYFDNKSLPAPPYKQNQFGATFGGPVGRKTFFFGSYEGLRIRQTLTGQFSVPTLAMRSGDFSAFVNNPAARQPAPKDPKTGQLFPNNQIPQQRMDHAAQVLLGLLPQPTNANPLLLAGNFTGVPIKSVTSDQFSVRVDRQVGKQDSFFARFLFLDHRGLDPFPFQQFVSGGTNLPGFGEFVTNAARNLALGYTKVFSSVTVLDLHFGYNRTSGGQHEEAQPLDFGKLTGIQGLTNNADEFGPPVINIAGFNPFGGPSGDTGRFDETYEWSANLTHIHGRHSLQFGGDVSRLHFNPTSKGHRGMFTYTGFLTGNAFADYLLGVPFSATNAFGDSRVTHLRALGYSFYVEDKLRLGTRLVLELGTRYDYRSPFTEINGRRAGFSLNPLALVLPGSTGNFIGTPWMDLSELKDIQAHIPVVGTRDIGYPTSIIRPDRNNFAPRVGFAWTPFANQKTVVRGGYGIFYDFEPGWLTLVSVAQAPFNTSKSTLNTTLQAPMETSLTNAAAPTIGLTVFPTDFRTPYVQQASFGIQHSPLRDLLVELRYNWTKGTKLFTSDRFNFPTVLGNQNTKPIPFLAPTAIYITNGGFSTYNGMTLRAEKRMSHGFSVSGNWVWSRSIDNDSLLASTVSTNLAQSRNLKIEKGLSTFQTSHRLVAYYLYELPFGRGRKWGNSLSGVAQKIVEGWYVTGITTFQTGLPFSVSIAQDRCGGGIGNCRPNRIADGNLPASQRDPQHWFDTSAFVPQPLNTLGTSGRDILWGPGIDEFDVSFGKYTKISENQQIRFQTDFFNFANHPIFDFPQRVIDAGGFGQIFTARDPRLVQFSLKYSF